MAAIQAQVMTVHVFLLAAQLAAVPAWPPAQTSAPPPDSAGPSIPLSVAVSQARTSSPRRRAAWLAVEGARDAARFAGRLSNPIFELRTENWSATRRPAAPEIDVFAVLTRHGGNFLTVLPHLAVLLAFALVLFALGTWRLRRAVTA